MKYALEVSDLRKSFRDNKNVVNALNGVNFNIEKGEIFGLLGPNGAGKSTTINVLTGLLTPDSGSVKYFGMDFCEDIQNMMNTATAYRALNRNLTVYQNLHVIAALYNVKDHKKKIYGLLKQFKIESLANKLVGDLSSGQRTRVNLCKALVNSPKLLFLDEATAGLDPQVAATVRQVIKDLDATIIFTSHIMSEVEELCDRIAFLDNGKVIAIDTPHAIKGITDEKQFCIEFSKKTSNVEKYLKGYDILYSDDENITIDLKDQKDIHKIIKILIENGNEINDLHIKKPSLDEIFIKIAEGHFRGDLK